MPHIERPLLVNGRPLAASDPAQIEWGTARGRTHIGHYSGRRLPGFVFQRQNANTNDLLAALTRLEPHMPTPEYFFLGMLDVIGYRDLTNSRALIDPAQTQSRWRVMESLGRVADYLSEIRVGETFIPNVGNIENLCWGHPHARPSLNKPYLGFDPLPTLATREAPDAPGEAPFAAAVGSVASTLEAVRIARGDTEAVETLAALQQRVASLLPN